MSNFDTYLTGASLNRKLGCHPPRSILGEDNAKIGKGDNQ